MTRKINPTKVDLGIFALPVEKGGTGAASLSDAATNLNVVKNADKDMPNGVVSLGAAGTIPLTLMQASLNRNPLSLDGDFNVYTGTTVNFTITDYDMFKSYTVSASVGTVSRLGDSITYTAPATSQAATLTINGRTIALNVLVPAPAVPSIVTPVNAATNQGISNLSITSSTFQALGATFTHQSTDWQVATDAAFTNIVSQSLNDTVNKTTWTVPVTLSLSTTYFLRVRYKGSNGNSSAWSTVSSFTTKVLTEATTEIQSFGQSDFSGVSFPYFLSISDDGNRVVTSYSRNSGYNMAQYPYVRVAAYHRSNGVWSRVWYVDIDPNMPANFNTGFWRIPFQGARISPDGNRIFTLQTCNGPGITEGSGYGNADGLVGVYTWNGSSYVLEATLTPDTSSSYNSFGFMIAFNSDASRVVIASGYGYSENAYTQLFVRSGTNWIRGSKQTNQRISFITQAIGNLTMSRDGTRYAVSFPTSTGNNGFGTWIVASVYTINAAAYTCALEQNINYNYNLSTAGMGNYCTLNSDGSRLLFSSYGGSGDTNVNSVTSGAIYEVNRSGTTWTDSGNRITNDDATSSERFGWSIRMNATGNKFIATAPYATVNGVATKGCYYLYEKVGSSWTRRAKVTNTLNAADYLGYYFDATLALDVVACLTNSVAKITMFA